MRGLVDLELSIGDYVLSGGELPALVVIDAVLRLLPGRHRRGIDGRGVVRRGPPRVPAVHAPAEFRGKGVPDILTSGDHGAVARWRRSRRARGRARGARTCSTSRAAAGRPRPGPRAISRTGRPAAPLRTPQPQPRLPTGPRNRRVNVLDEIVEDQLRTDLPELATGDTVKVSAKVVEGNRERIQVFEGTVMRLRGGGITRSITVRRIATGVGVERTFKIHSPRIEKIEVVRHGQVRRAQLYFLRDRVGKAATLRERRTNGCPGGRVRPRRPRRRRGRSMPDRLPWAPMAVIVPTLRHERRLWNEGLTRVAGVDEVGVAPTCGAVVAAAVIMNPGCHRIPGVRDSKTLSMAQRERLAPIIRARAVAIGVGAASVREIDSSTSTTRLTRDAPGDRARRRHGHVMVDGNRIVGFEARSGRTEHRQRRREGLLDRLRVRRGQGRPRPMMTRLGGALRLRLGAQPGLRHRDHRGAIREIGPRPFPRRSFLALQRTLAGDQLAWTSWPTRWLRETHSDSARLVRSWRTTRRRPGRPRRGSTCSMTWSRSPDKRRAHWGGERSGAWQASAA